MEVVDAEKVLSFLPLTPAVFHIALALADSDRHGYAIAVEVAARTGRSVQLGPGTLYGTISRMAAAGLIEPVDGAPVDDARDRRYHRLTELGRAVVRAEARRLRQLVEIAEAKALFSDGL
jgi:DNA-binding PadR family transcriptional regulator